MSLVKMIGFYTEDEPLVYNQICTLQPQLSLGVYENLGQSLSFIDQFTVVAELPALWLEARLPGTLF